MIELPGVKVTSWPATADRENEDSSSYKFHTAVVVDGAGLPKSMRSGCSHSVSWYSQSLAAAFQSFLTDPQLTMQEALRAAISAVVAIHENTCDLTAGSPSATVAAYRITGSHLEYLVLCDSSILLSFIDGRYLEVTDDRISQVIEPWIEMALAQDSRSDSLSSPQELLVLRGKALDALRNTSDGFWCCQFDPAAADEALVGYIPLHELRGAVLATDGVTRGIHLLGSHTLDGVVEAALSNEHDQLLEQIRAAEVDQTETLIARAIKVHDDATLVSANIG